MSGLPITVNRVYDSRDKRVGDFGVGWRLDIQTLRLRTNRNFSDGWSGTRSGGIFPNYCVVAADDHKVSITLADGTVEEFDMTLDNPCQQIIPLQFSTVSWRARAGTRGTLVSLDQSDVFVTGSFPGPIVLNDGGLIDPFNPQTYQYTTYEGMQFVINKSDGVLSAKDPNGNTLTFNAGGIIHSSGASVVFNRDGFGRITRMTAPDGKVSTYAYDANGDLASYADPAAEHDAVFLQSEPWRHRDSRSARPPAAEERVRRHRPAPRPHRRPGSPRRVRTRRRQPAGDRPRSQRRPDRL